ncbi:amino acid carrier protein [Candidatus Comchoanobacter bicostacola]|uniref:Amino acid carrier protein n=1 Tax=Candidatus Comchoanobacter bicostacola TaxID=2919598 RepID=A0ABY5DMG0_9GAMM|nr:amino acid carrier protein [Candidatus Comchoanobacter bicostacola]UTC24896.1 amino acid carrier protein [Candidatus Comchoanobacter bicostacola]
MNSAYLTFIDDFLWAYIAIPAIMLMGFYLSYRYGFKQITEFPKIFKEFWDCCYTQSSERSEGIHPVQAFFTTMGGCIGVGNLVAVCTAVRIGGPGALFWMWITALIGMTVKYAEVSLSMKSRVIDSKGGYNGGPMYYISHSLAPALGTLFAVLLAIYGIEVYMFKVVVQTISNTWAIQINYVVAALLALVIYAVQGGAKRVGELCSILIPVFVAVFLFMSLWIIAINYQLIPQMLLMIIQSAFKGHAPIGAFAGSTVVLALSQGVKRACYTGDIGVGYAGVVCAQAHEDHPEQQARFTYLGIFLDTFVVCTLSILLILVTDTWVLDIPDSQKVMYVLAEYFPAVNVFMPLFIFMLGYSTIVAFFHVGLCCADYISERYGRYVYYFYALCAFTTFSYLDEGYALLVMNICGALMLILNLLAIYKKRYTLSM